MNWFEPLLRPELSEIQTYQPAAMPAGAVRLDTNENPHALNERARRRLAQALAAVDLHRYPDGRATRLRETVAARTGAHPDQIVLGCGSDEVIALVLAALSRAPAGRARATVLFPDPTFVMFRISALAQGLEPVPVPLDAGWDLDVGAFVAAIETHRPNVVYLPSPNNPTGTLFAPDRIERVIDAARGRALVLLDEAYGAFSGVSYAHLREAHPHVGQLQTLSKMGLAAARVGWAILPAELASWVDRVRQPYNLNVLSQCVAELFLSELHDEVAAQVGAVVAERGRLAARLAALPGITVAPSAANFLWVDVGRDAGEVYRGLAARGVLVRSFHTRGGRLARHLRITVGTTEENDRLLEALAALLG
jgi:histidinol-phosphate aminotransferase